MANFNKDNHILLYACCIPVKGIKRSIIIDTERNNFHFIPNDLYDIIESDFGKLKIGGIFSKYGTENQDQLKEYFELLINNEIGFETDEPKLFPKLSLRWESPRMLSNAIIDISKNSCYDILDAIKELDELGVECIQIRIFKNVMTEYLIELLSRIEHSTNRVRSIELLIPFDMKQDFSNIFYSNLVSSVIFYGAPNDELKIYKQTNTPTIYTTQKIENCSSCGNISPLYFSTNISHVSESIQFNNCLNRKISIDEYGEIKNCPSFIRSFGSVGKTSLKDVVNCKEFTDVWQISKDKVSVCKICEFRLICSDCRAYTLENDLYSKPLKCNYDPYTCKWSDQD